MRCCPWAASSWHEELQSQRDCPVTFARSTCQKRGYLCFTDDGQSVVSRASPAKIAKINEHEARVMRRVYDLLSWPLRLCSTFLRATFPSVNFDAIQREQEGAPPSGSLIRESKRRTPQAERVTLLLLPVIASTCFQVEITSSFTFSAQASASRSSCQSILIPTAPSASSRGK